MTVRKVGIYIEMSLRSSHVRELYQSIIHYGRLKGWQLFSNKVAGTQPLGPLDQWKGDGLIAHTLGQREPLEQLRQRQIPIINLSSSGGDLGLPSVWLDDAHCAQLAVEHWAGKGMQHYAFFGNDQLAYSRQRGKSYVQKLQHLSQTVHYFGDAHDPFSAEMPSANEVQWIKDLPSSTAVFCSDDMRAQFVSQQLIRHGRDIPNEIIILGVGDDTMICELNQPTLSSIPYPGKLIGSNAAAALEQAWFQQSQHNQVQLIQPVEVIARDSSRRWDDPLIQQAMFLIQGHAGQADYKVSDLAEQLQINRRLIERRFKEQLGESPLEKLHEQRCHIAQRYLRHTELSIKKIAENMGFKAPEKFSRFFQQHHGCSPKEWRAQST